MNKKEYFDRNYDLQEIEEDPRFKVCFNEMLISFGVFLSYLISMIYAAYSFSNVSPDMMTFTMGIPTAWFVCLFILVFFIGVTWFVVKNIFKDMDLTDEGKVYWSRYFNSSTENKLER